MMNSEQTLRPNTLAVERLGNRVTLIVICDTAERAKNMYDQVCAEAREGYVMVDLETVPRPVLGGQTLLPREHRDD
jgi:lysyl-tRNA synthetase class I